MKVIKTGRASTWSLVSIALLIIQIERAQARETLAITHVTVVDVKTGQVAPNSTVTIDSDRGVIASITANGEPSSDVRVIDAPGKFVIPGLWDMHAHHQASGEVSLPLYLANGVTGTRDMGSDLDFVLQLRQATASSVMVGPRIVAAGPILDDAPPDWPYRLQVKTAEDGRRAGTMLKERGVDFIKVHDRTPREAYFAIAEEAKIQNLHLAGHVPRGITFEEAVDAGQRSFEHLAGFRVFRQCSGGQEYRPETCRPFFQWLAQRGVWQTPTLGSWRYLMTIGTAASTVDRAQLVYASPSLREIWALNQQVSKLTQAQIDGAVAAADVAAVAVSDMHEAGVGLLAGCDGTIPGFCVHDELMLMVQGGLSPVAALQTATINPARYFGSDESLGTVEPGKVADLVLLDGSPLDAIENVRRIWAVVARGKLFSRAELDSILAQVKRRVQQPD